MLVHIFAVIMGLICIYTLRHYCFTASRVLGRQRHPYTDVDTADWPAVTVFIAAHNEAASIGAKLENILSLDYPVGQLEVVIASDGSDDGTDS